jgi:hypothetical protein
MSMRTPIELRNDAWECLQQAEQAPAQRDKAILLILAQGWASLADELERLGLVPDQAENGTNEDSAVIAGAEHQPGATN